MNSLGLQEPCVYIREQVEQSISNSENVQTMIRSLNSDQNEAFNLIIEHIDKKGSLFYLDGPAGTGKTYLYNVLCSYLKSTIQLATTGISADLLQEGRTMHSVMKLPVPLTESSISRLQRNTPKSERIIKASLILIDEVSMMS
ncbi:PREDICTED: uncharacterized protein LOC107073307 [Polistes dominula]|uniref:ATP-dependent DNA helicase n=1 Tax=Polistes dominula TaxID=743375 RepID=A0ABM1JA96_POLDO|nr:PREDICTED: uncharacterized protein LOC107073307 [Polistes dominula]